MKHVLALIFLTLASAIRAELVPVEALAELPAMDVLVLGEVHDNPVHHENQARAVAAVKPAAIVFEMLSQDQANMVSDENRGDVDALAQALGWEGTGWPDFAFYHPIFLAAPEAAIFGGKTPRAVVRRAISEGAAAVFDGDAQDFGLVDELPEAQQTAREAIQREAHCNALPENLLPGMVQAQRLRDAGLAAGVLRAMERTGGPVVLITGNGHARRDWGATAMLEAVRPRLDVLSVAQFEAAPEKNPPFDVHLITEPAIREDTCAVFNKG